MKSVTKWHRKSFDGGYDFNHIEDGHCLSLLPTPKVDCQQGMWAKGAWKAEYVYLDDNIPPRIVYEAA